MNGERTGCTRETPEFCPPAECTADTECTGGSSCVTNECSEGVCLAFADSSSCTGGQICNAMAGCVPRGGSDAGPDAAIDAGTDAASDAGMDAGTDAGPGTCNDRIRNGLELGVDCGGPCSACDSCASLPGALFCSSFEQPELADWSRLAVAGGGTLSVGSDAAFHGTSMAATTPAAGRAFVEARIAGQTSGTVYARFYLYVPAGPISGSTEIFKISDGATRSAALWLLPSDEFEFTLGADANSPPDTPVLRDQWMCIQFTVNIAASGNYGLRVDAGPTWFSPSQSTTPDAVGYDEVNAGVLVAPGGIGIRVDELVVANAPLDCALTMPDPS